MSEETELAAALEPFAELAAVFDKPGGTTPTTGEIYTWSRMVDGQPKDYTLTVEMLQAARAAIAAWNKRQGSGEAELVEAGEPIGTPWHRSLTGGFVGKTPVRGIATKDGLNVAWVSGHPIDTDKVMAAILTAVNGHADLVEALKTALETPGMIKGRDAARATLSRVQAREGER